MKSVRWRCTESIGTPVGIAAGLLLGVGALWAASERGAPEHLPLGVSAVMYELSVPADAAPTPDRIALGQKLFLDKRLSVDGTVSCSTCPRSRER